MTITDPSPVLEVVGVVAFAVSGAAVAIRARMDWVGVAVLAAVTAVGGGTLRDLLLGRFPVGWVADPWPVWVAIGTAALVIAQAHLRPRSAPDETLVVLVADAAGLAVFTVASTLMALSGGASAPVAVLIGAVTGTGGGIARDVLARQRPLVLVGQVYALTAVGGATLLVVLLATGVPTTPARWCSVAAVLALRLAAIRYSWSLPRAPQLPPGPER
jgi:uncharacterized membrane protein YeiH